MPEADGLLYELNKRHNGILNGINRVRRQGRPWDRGVATKNILSRLSIWSMKSL